MPTSGIRGFKWNNATQGVQGQIVKLTASGVVDFCTAITDVPIGFLLNQPKQNESAQVAMPGDDVAGPICLVLLNGTSAITFGDLIKTNATGRGVKAAVAGAYITTVAYVVGNAMEAWSTASDALIPVRINIVEGQYA